MSLLSPVSLSQKAASVADTGDAHKKRRRKRNTKRRHWSRLLKGNTQTSLPLKHCKLVAGRFDASNWKYLTTAMHSSRPKCAYIARIRSFKWWQVFSWYTPQYGAFRYTTVPSAFKSAHSKPIFQIRHPVQDGKTVTTIYILQQLPWAR